MILHVLHIGNTAGIGSVLAKYQKKFFKWKTDVLVRKELDKFNITTYGTYIYGGRTSFYICVLRMFRKYDIVHIHSLDKLVPLLKIIDPRKKIVLHYHGSDIRGKWHIRKKYWKYADKILVATPDLLKDAPPSTSYLPNPVDTELFMPLPGLKSRRTALFIYGKHEKFVKSIEWAKELARKYSLKLYIHNRDENPIPYRRMPYLLNRFEYFIDHRFVPALSLTALEALACGLKVFRWDGKIIDKLPEEHLPLNVIKRLWNIYREILEDY
ncbi:MAG: hypothetical protein B6U89_00790 [Desulfurococcales archaeon ex4484_58]|nr:MAG: hypothetical protein B6U89_00790 [Desulfurococcales archaeon ex4484_58]